MDELEKKFFDSTGITLTAICNKQGLLSYFSKGKNKFSKENIAGRGYPFFDQKSVSAKQKDKQNMDILSKW